MKRIMAIDYGQARTGVAFSDLSCSIAGHCTVLHESDPERLIAALQGLVEQEQVGTIVMGYPRNMDGSEGPRAALYQAFAAQLEAAVGLPVTSGTSAVPPSTPTASSPNKITTAKTQKYRRRRRRFADLGAFLRSL